MLVSAVQHYIGFSAEGSKELAFVLCVIALVFTIAVMVGVYTIIADAVGELQIRSARKTHAAPKAGRISGAAPDLPMPSSGHEECGGKFCELRGCSILGSCQAPS